MTSPPPQSRPLRARTWRIARRGLLVGIVICSLLVASFFIAANYFDYPQEFSRSPASGKWLQDRRGELLAAFAAPDGQWRLPYQFEDFSPHLVNAIIAVEDARFYDHHGIDWK